MEVEVINQAMQMPEAISNVGVAFAFAFSVGGFMWAVH